MKMQQRSRLGAPVARFDARPDWVELTYWLLGVPVFYIATAIAMRGGFDSRILTAPIRVCGVVIGAVAMWRLLAFRYSPSIPVRVFWAVSFAYFLRLVVDEFGGKADDFSKGSVVIQFLGTTVIPAFYMLIRPSPNLRTLRYLWGSLLILCSSLYFMYRGLPMHAEGLRTRGVMEMMGVINPIIVGHLGALLLELSLYLVLFTHRKVRLIYLSGLVGLLLMLISNSRGPVLALLLVGGLVVATKFWKSLKSGRSFVVFVFLLLLCCGAGYFVVAERESILLERVAERDGSGREFLYAECLKAAMRSPFWGESVFITMPDGTQSGTESFVLDPFLGTGIFGGAAWLLLLIYAGIKGVALFVRKPEFWIVLIFIHGVVLFGLSSGMISASWGYASFLGVLRLLQIEGRVLVRDRTPRPA